MSAKDDFELVKGAVEFDIATDENCGYKESAEQMRRAFNNLFTPRPLEQWHEDMGDCLWYKFPIDESPYVGSPLSDDWPDYHTHFTPLIPILTPDDMGVK